MPNPVNRRLVILDLDGTVTFSDTLVPFLMGCMMRYPRLKASAFILPAYAMLFAIGKVDSTALKEQLLMATIGGLPVLAVDQWAEEYASRVVESRCRPDMLSVIQESRQNGDRILLLSASPDLYVRSIAEGLGISETICTEVEVLNGCYTGRLRSQNCVGPEKLRRLQEYLGAQHYDGVTVAYGDRMSDLPVLRWANEGWLQRGGERVVAQSRCGRNGDFHSQECISRGGKVDAVKE